MCDSSEWVGCLCLVHPGLRLSLIRAPRPGDACRGTGFWFLVADFNSLPGIVRFPGTRMFPPVGGIVRDLPVDTEINGVMVDAGTTVVASIYGVHHNPEVWPEPEKFDPERFDPDGYGTFDFVWGHFSRGLGPFSRGLGPFSRGLGPFFTWVSAPCAPCDVLDVVPVSC